MTLDKLSASDILNFLREQKVPAHEFSVIVEDSLHSTNDYLLDLLQKNSGGMPKTAVLAETQTAGKGRQGRTWFSLRGNISMSVFWPFQGQLEKLYGLSLVVGIAVARVLKANGLVDVQLKWPNDIYWHGHKMGGILIETKQNRTGIIDTVIGLGLNIVEMDEYSKQIGQKCASLENAVQHKIYRDKLVAQLLIELDITLTTFTAKGFGDFIEEWQSLDSKIASNSTEMDLFSKIISAEKTLKHDGKFLH